jgi:hypothetical protein
MHEKGVRMAVSLFLASGKVNPAYLKLDLFCRGMTIDESASVDEDGRAILRTRAGLGSGLETVIPPDFHTNVPVLEPWVQKSPYRLHKERARYVIRREGEFVTDVTLPPPPRFYSQRTSSGKLMTSIGVLQGTYLGIYPGEVCHFWRTKPRTNCHFCSVGLNVGDGDAREKTVQDVLETVRAARLETGITFVHFNTGYYEGDTYLDTVEPFVRAVVRETGLLVGVQCPPHPDPTRYDRLRALGVNNVSFCLELWDDERFREVCPGKSRTIGKARYLEAIRYCAKRFDTTNGEMVAGLEAPEKTIEAIDWITSQGAIPTVCVFRPVVGSDYQDVPPPQTEEMVPVFARVYEACMERGLPIGIAPNVKVSIVLLPDECRALSPRAGAFRWRRAKLAAARTAFGLYFRARMWKRAARRVPVGLAASP